MPRSTLGLAMVVAGIALLYFVFSSPGTPETKSGPQGGSGLGPGAGAGKGAGGGKGGS